MFVNWLRYIFKYNNDDLLDEIQDIKEVKSMFANALEKYGKKLEKKAMQEGIEKGIQKGLQKGLQEGIQKGIEKGVRKGLRLKAFETAEALLKEQLPLEKVAAITGLKEKDVRELIRRLEEK